jgi:hypothetical protein
MKKSDSSGNSGKELAKTGSMHKEQFRKGISKLFEINISTIYTEVAHNGDMDTLTSLLKYKPDPFVKNHLQKTPLGVAADQQNLDVHKRLVEYQKEWCSQKNSSIFNFNKA